MGGVEPLTYRFLVGSSSRYLPLRASFAVPLPRSGAVAPSPVARREGAFLNQEGGWPVRASLFREVAAAGRLRSRRWRAKCKRGGIFEDRRRALFAAALGACAALTGLNDTPTVRVSESVFDAGP